MTKDLTQVNKCFCAITYVFSAFLILCYSICILFAEFAQIGRPVR